MSIASLRENDIPDTVFYVCAVLILASYAIVFLGVREPRQRAEVSGPHESISLHSYIGEIRGCREAFKLLVGVFFLWNGSSAVLPFLTIFIVKSMHATKSLALTVYVVAILASAICMYPFGRLGARHGSRPVIVLGTVLLIIAAGLGLVVPSYTWLFPEAILIGTGFAATNALTYPYLSQLVPAAVAATLQRSASHRGTGGLSRSYLAHVVHHLTAASTYRFRTKLPSVPGPIFKKWTNRPMATLAADRGLQHTKFCRAMPVTIELMEQLRS